MTLVPLYTPLLTDEPNVTRPHVLFGGISVYLQQHSALFRKMPRLVDRWLDSPRLIKAFADRSVSTDPRLLGGLTISMLEGAGGVLRKEFDKLLEWTAGEPAPDIVNLTNSMLIALARPMAEAFGRPVCCTLQGEDLFLDGLIEPYRTHARDLIRRQIQHVDRFVAVSDYYAAFMADTFRYCDLVSSSGYHTAGFDGAPLGRRFRFGYFREAPPEKGIHVLADAFQPYGNAMVSAHPPRGRGIWPTGTRRISPMSRDRRARRDRRRLRISGRPHRTEAGVSADGCASVGELDAPKAFFCRGDGERCPRVQRGVALHKIVERRAAESLSSPTSGEPDGRMHTLCGIRYPRSAGRRVMRA